MPVRPFYMVYLGKEEFKGIIAHFYASGFVVAVGEHFLEIGPEVLCACELGVFFNKIEVILDMPPVAITGAYT